MIKDTDFLLLKNILLKNFANTYVTIILNGSIQTQILIKDSKIIISNEDKDFTIDFIMMKNIILDDEYRIKIVYNDFEIILEI